MIIRKLRLNTDWPTLHSFWQQKGLPPVPLELLPPTGVVAERVDGVLLCGGFLVKSDTAMASLAFICGNPHVEKAERGEALDAMILELVRLGMRSGFKAFGAATNIRALQERYERLEFIKTDENVTCFGGFI